MRIKLNKAQICMGINIQRNLEIHFRYGSNWASVTQDFVTEIVKRKEGILAMYKYSFCPDEIYKQTFAFNSKFHERVFDLNDEFHGCMRDIDWTRGRPYTWHTEADYNYLSTSERLFARKFDYDIYPEFVNKLIYKIRNE